MANGHDFFFRNCGTHAKQAILATFGLDVVQKDLKSRIGCACEFFPLRFEVECPDPVDLRAHVTAICRTCDKSIKIDHLI